MTPVKRAAKRRFAAKVEFHQRQLVDSSDPTYIGAVISFAKSHERQFVDISDLAYLARVNRQDLNDPSRKRSTKYHETIRVLSWIVFLV